MDERRLGESEHQFDSHAQALEWLIENINQLDSQQHSQDTKDSTYQTETSIATTGGRVAALSKIALLQRTRTGSSIPEKIVLDEKNLETPKNENRLVHLVFTRPYGLGAQKPWQDYLDNHEIKTQIDVLSTGYENDQLVYQKNGQFLNQITNRNITEAAIDVLLETPKPTTNEKRLCVVIANSNSINHIATPRESQSKDLFLGYDPLVRKFFQIAENKLHE